MFQRLFVLLIFVSLVSYSNAQDTVRVNSVLQAVTESNAGKKVVLFMYQMDTPDFPKSFASINKENLIGLIIDNCGFTSFPDFLGEYDQVSYFRYSWFYFSEPPIDFVPSFLCEMNGLKSLKIEGIKLKSVPACLGQMTQLETLSLYHTELPEFPREVLNLSNLTRLDLECQKFTRIPSDIDRLSKLKRLSFEGGACGATPIASVPESIGNLRNLEMFNLGYAEVGIESLPASFYTLEKLQYFGCHGCGLKRLDERIENMKSLEVLYLMNIKSFEPFPEKLFTLPNLSTFQFYQYGKANPALKAQKVKLDEWGKSVKDYSFEINEPN